MNKDTYMVVDNNKYTIEGINIKKIECRAYDGVFEGAAACITFEQDGETRYFINNSFVTGGMPLDEYALTDDNRIFDFYTKDEGDITDEIWDTLDKYRRKCFIPKNKVEEELTNLSKQLVKEMCEKADIYLDPEFAD